MHSFALTLHIISIILLVPVILYTDHLGLSWVRGHRETLSLCRLKFLHRTVSIGLLLMLVSGGIMFMGLKEFLLITPAFYAKMTFVGILIINSFFIGKLMCIATERPFRDLSKRERGGLFISGAVSGIAWVCTIALGFFLSTMV